MKSEKEKEKGGRKSKTLSFRVIFLKVKSPSSRACFKLAESLERLMILSGVPSILSHSSPVENHGFFNMFGEFLELVIYQSNYTCTFPSTSAHFFVRTK